MNNGKGFAILGIWVGCGLASIGGMHEPTMFGAAAISTIAVAIFF